MKERRQTWWWLATGAFIAIAVVFGIASGVRAQEFPPHYSDGTTYEGNIDWGHPVFGDVNCETVEVDPPGFIWATIHYDFTDDGEFVEEAFDVFEYDRPVGGWIERPNPNPDGYSLMRVTWNIGLGYDEAEVDCTPETPTTTTPPTTVPPTTQPPQPPQISTPTTVIPPAQDVDHPLAPVTTGVTPTETLPETGSTTLPLLVAGLSTVAAGTGLALQRRRNR